MRRKGILFIFTVLFLILISAGVVAQAQKHTEPDEGQYTILVVDSYERSDSNFVTITSGTWKATLSPSDFNTEDPSIRVPRSLTAQHRYFKINNKNVPSNALQARDFPRTTPTTTEETTTTTEDTTTVTTPVETETAQVPPQIFTITSIRRVTGDRRGNIKYVSSEGYVFRATVQDSKTANPWIPIRHDEVNILGRRVDTSDGRLYFNSVLTSFSGTPMNEEAFTPETTTIVMTNAEYLATSIAYTDENGQTQILNWRDSNTRDPYVEVNADKVIINGQSIATPKGRLYFDPNNINIVDNEAFMSDVEDIQTRDLRAIKHEGEQYVVDANTQEVYEATYKEIGETNALVYPGDDQLVTDPELGLAVLATAGLVTQEEQVVQQEEIEENTGTTTEGESIVDAMNERGLDYSFTNRRQLYYSIYGTDETYTGTAEQNLRMLAYLRANDFDTNAIAQAEADRANEIAAANPLYSNEELAQAYSTGGISRGTSSGVISTRIENEYTTTGQNYLAAVEEAEVTEEAEVEEEAAAEEVVAEAEKGKFDWRWLLLLLIIPVGLGAIFIKFKPRKTKEERVAERTIKKAEREAKRRGTIEGQLISLIEQKGPKIATNTILAKNIQESKEKVAALNMKLRSYGHLCSPAMSDAEFNKNPVLNLISAHNWPDTLSNIKKFQKDIKLTSAEFKIITNAREKGLPAEKLTKGIDSIISINTKESSLTQQVLDALFTENKFLTTIISKIRNGRTELERSLKGRALETSEAILSKFEGAARDDAQKVMGHYNTVYKFLQNLKGVLREQTLMLNREKEQLAAQKGSLSTESAIIIGHLNEEAKIIWQQYEKQEKPIKEILKKDKQVIRSEKVLLEKLGLIEAEEEKFVAKEEEKVSAAAAAMEKEEVPVEGSAAKSALEEETKTSAKTADKIRKDIENIK